jgi:hypothetical protein
MDITAHKAAGSTARITDRPVCNVFVETFPHSDHLVLLETETNQSISLSFQEAQALVQSLQAILSNPVDLRP